MQQTRPFRRAAAKRAESLGQGRDKALELASDLAAALLRRMAVDLRNPRGCGVQHNLMQPYLMADFIAAFHKAVKPTCSCEN